MLAKARRGELPAHPWGCGVRRMWRFRLSELEAWMTENLNRAKRPPIEHRRRGGKAEHRTEHGEVQHRRKRAKAA